jgi:peptide/nickel transport system substrate-binding protein
MRFPRGREPVRWAAELDSDQWDGFDHSEPSVPVTETTCWCSPIRHHIVAGTTRTCGLENGGTALKHSKVLAILMSFGLVVGACGGDGDDDVGSSDTTQAADGTSTTGDGGDGEICTEDKVGGALTLSTLSNSPSLDVYTVGGGTSQGSLELLALYDTLLRFDEATGEFVGQLAESIEPNDDASEWTLKLREGVEFGNGDPLDAAAVKASIDRHLDPEGSSRMKSVRGALASVEVVDPLTVKFILTQPWGFFPIHLSAGGGTVGALGMIQNVKLIEERGADAFGQDSTGGGAGPYELKSWAPPEEAVLEAKSDWWGGPVCIQELRFAAMNSGQARLDGLRTGEIDMALEYRDPVVAAEAKEEFDFVRTIHQAGQTLEFNFTDPELSDVRTRRALALAIDPEVINDRAFGGEALVGKGLVSDASTLLKATEGIEYDAAAAKALVEELKAEGMSLEFELLNSDQAANVEAGLALKAMLDAAGFTINIRNVPTAQIISSVFADRNFQMVYFGNVGPEVTLYASLYKMDGRNPANAYGLKDGSYDAALDALRVAVGADALQEAADNMQEVLNELVPFVVLSADEGIWLRRDGIHGVQYTRGITPLFDKAFIKE